MANNIQSTMFTCHLHQRADCYLQECEVCEQRFTGRGHRVGHGGQGVRCPSCHQKQEQAVRDTAAKNRRNKRRAEKEALQEAVQLRLIEDPSLKVAHSAHMSTRGPP